MKNNLLRIIKKVKGIWVVFLTSNLIILATGSAQLNEATPSVSPEPSPFVAQTNQTAFLASTPTRSFKKDPTGSFYEDELIVHFKSNVTASQKQELLLQAGKILYEGRSKSFLLKVDPVQRDRIFAALKAHSNVEYVSYNTVGHANEGGGGAPAGGGGSSSCSPNDPYYCYFYSNIGVKQWGLTKIEAPTAWLFNKGSSSVKIAVLDSGVDYNRVDLNGGKVIKGVDLIPEPNDNDPMDESSISHGTAVAGVAAANTNNAQGIAGVDWYAKIVAIRTSPGYLGNSDPYFFAEGIYRAVDDHHAQVINISYSFADDVPDLRNAVEYAQTDGGAIIVASAYYPPGGGLYPANPSACFMEFPAAYFGVISVVATDEGNNLAYGCTGNVKGGTAYQPIQIAAPGRNIISLIRGSDQVALYNGTSVAAPHVAGVASVLRSCTSESKTDAVYDIILGAYDVGTPGWDNKFGFGVLNMNKSLERARLRGDC